MAGLIALFLNPSGDFAWAKNGRGQWAGMTPADFPLTDSSLSEQRLRHFPQADSACCQLFRSAQVCEGLGSRTRTSFLAASIEVARPLRLAAEFSPQTSSAACFLHSCSEESAARRGLDLVIPTILWPGCVGEFPNTGETAVMRQNLLPIRHNQPMYSTPVQFWPVFQPTAAGRSPTDGPQTKCKRCPSPIITRRYPLANGFHLKVSG
jgi:hypothetical protein